MNESKPILLVEDDCVDVMTVERALGDLGITNPLVHKTNGEEALQYLRESSEMPSVILLDLNMPVMDGIEFLEVAKADEELKNIPAVVFISSKQDTGEIDSLNLDIAGYITKISDYKKFMEEIRPFEQYCSLSESSEQIQPSEKQPSGTNT